MLYSPSRSLPEKSTSALRNGLMQELPARHPRGLHRVSAGDMKWNSAFLIQLSGAEGNYHKLPHSVSQPCSIFHTAERCQVGDSEEPHCPVTGEGTPSRNFILSTTMMSWLLLPSHYLSDGNLRIDLTPLTPLACPASLLRAAPHTQRTCTVGQMRDDHSACEQIHTFICLVFFAQPTASSA